MMPRLINLMGKELELKHSQKIFLIMELTIKLVVFAEKKNVFVLQ
jgi:hypothetical protein